MKTLHLAIIAILLFPIGINGISYGQDTANSPPMLTDGLTIFCAPMPLAAGYDNNSTITASNFPWVGKQFECPMLTYDFHIVSTTGIGVKHIPWK